MPQLFRIALLVICLAPCVLANFQAGTAKVDITPAPGSAVSLASQPLAPNDSLFARVLILKSGTISLAILSIDAIVFASPRIAEEAKARCGITHVIQSATHTHTGMTPEGMRIGGPEKRPDWTRSSKAPNQTLDWPAFSKDPWYQRTEQKILEAIEHAHANLFPARVAMGSGDFESVYMAHNRRLVTENGVTMLWENPDRRPTSPRDQTVGVIRVEDLSGKQRALAVLYACHPVAMMNAGVVSRDYPGATVDAIEASLGPDCLGLFLQGASGDLDPFDLQSLRSRNRANISKQAGLALANRALELAAGLTPSPSLEPFLVKERLLEVPNRTPNESTPVNLLTLQIGTHLALAAIPGEPFVQHQLNLRARCKSLRNVFVLGLAYSGKGCPFLVYIPTAQAVKEGGYGATECSFLAPEAGERIIDELVRMLN